MLNKKIKLFLIIPSLHKGGAEKIMVTLANNLNKNIFDVTLILLEQRGSYLALLKDDIKVKVLNISSVKKSFFPLKKIITLENPDIVFSALGHLNLMLSSIKFFTNKKIKFIARETNIPSIINRTEKFSLIFDILYKLLYSNFDRIICQSNDMANDLEKNFNINKNLITIINNPVDILNINKMIKKKKVSFPQNKVNFISVGSLEYRKGFDLLLKSWHDLKDKSKMYLTIIGEGSLKNELIYLIKKYRLESSVTLIEFQNNPYTYMAEADYFILSSRFEGFPNVLLEALACGTPAIAFNCLGGVSEILTDGKNGWIVKANSTMDMTNRIENCDNILFSSKEISKNIKDRYNIEYILKQYESMFIDVINKLDRV